MDLDQVRACIEYGRKQAVSEMAFAESLGAKRANSVAKRSSPAKGNGERRSEPQPELPFSAPMSEVKTPAVKAAKVAPRHPKQEGLTKAITDALSDGDNWDIGELAKKTKAGTQAIRQALSGLKKKGLADSDGKGIWFGKAAA